MPLILSLEAINEYFQTIYPEYSVVEQKYVETNGHGAHYYDIVTDRPIRHHSGAVRSRFSLVLIDAMGGKLECMIRWLI